MRTSLIPSLLVVGAVAACADTDVEAPVDLTMREALAAPRGFDVAPAASTGRVHAAVQRGDKLVSSDAVLTVRGGRIGGQADGDRLVVEALTLELGDIALPRSIFSQDLTLTDVRVQLATPLAMPAMWSDDLAGAAAAGAVLQLDWSLRVNGATYPLGSQMLHDLDVEVAVGRQPDELRMDLTMSAPGVVWSWADLVALSDLELTVAALAPIE